MCGVGSTRCGGAIASQIQPTNSAQPSGTNLQQVLTSTMATDQARAGATSHAHPSGDHIVYQRASANDTARATRILEASMKLLNSLTFDGTEASAPGAGKPFNPNNSHRRIPADIQAQWKALYPDLPVPKSVVFDVKTKTVIGAVFMGSKTTQVDLGMGSQHKHQLDGAYMQHVWFTPGNLDLAFSDSERKQEAKVAALAR